MKSDDSTLESALRLPSEASLTPPSPLPDGMRAEGADLGNQVMKASIRAALFQRRDAQPIKLGRFVLIERIGVGGMGEIYTAYDERLDRKVALKLVRSDRATSELRQRLLREAQVLAKLSHPNVVQVHEAGELDDQVYVVMELIRGQTLRQWLRQHADEPPRLRWRRVLEVFLGASSGLEAVHRAGLVHRDFKPDNVLVGHDGRVCVADFGLARTEQTASTTQSTAEPLVEREAMVTTAPGAAASSLATLTASGTILGTPAYMPPEQMLGHPCDSRSDQFSFCVALYEALYGDRPFRGEEPAALRRRVLAGEITAPPRGSPVPARIGSVLLRGLAVAPDDRYPDMGQLRAALLDAAQRWRPWHSGVAASAAVALLAALYRAAVPTAPEPCAQAGTELAELWSPQVADGIAAAFARSGLPYAAVAWPRVRERIDGYAAELGSARQAACEAHYVRREQSEALFDLRTLCLDHRQRELSALIQQLGAGDSRTVTSSVEAAATLPAVAACADSEALALGLQPPHDPAQAAQVASIQDHLATAGAQQHAGQNAQATAVASAALDRAAKVGYPPVHAEALYRMGRLWLDAGSAADVENAQRALLEAADMAELHRHDELLADVWLALTLLASRHHSNLDLGHQWARRGVATSQRVPDRGARYSRALSVLGSLHVKQGDLERAEQHQRQGLALAEQHGGIPLEEAERWHALGNTLVARSRPTEAEAAFTRALDIYRAELGNGHPRIARVSHDLGQFLLTTGAFAAARQHLGTALSIWTAIHGPEHVDVGRAQLALADLEQQAGNLEAAEAHARAGRDIYGKALAAGDPRHAMAEENLGTIAFRRGRYDDALAAYERALAMRRGSYGDTHLYTLITRSNIGETLVLLGRHDQALTWLAEVEAALAQNPAVPPVLGALVHKSRGLALLGKGAPRAAVAPLEQALALLAGEPGYPLEQADVRWALAQALARVSASGCLDQRPRTLAKEAQALYLEHGVPATASGARPGKDIPAWLAKHPACR